MNPNLELVNRTHLLLIVGSEFLGARINVRHAAKKPPGQQQHSMPPRGKGQYTDGKTRKKITQKFTCVQNFSSFQLAMPLSLFLCGNKSVCAKL